METNITVADRSALDAFQAWGAQRELRGKGIADTAAKVMRWWVEGALAEIPAGDRGKVESYLKKRVVEYSSIKAMSARGAAPTTKAGQKKLARANALRDTLAARIVGALNIYQSRGKGFEQFYANVNKFINAKKFSVNIHRAGMLPARKALKLGDRRGPMPRAKNLPGSYQETITDQVVSLMVENWGSSFGGDGIVKLAGSAFEKGMAKVTERIAGYVALDVAKAAARSGLQVNNVQS